MVIKNHTKVHGKKKFVISEKASDIVCNRRQPIKIQRTGIVVDIPL